MAIVYPEDNWILSRAGKELEGLEFPGTYFINYAMFDEKQPRPWGAFFTHIEPKYEELFNEVADKVSYAVCSNRIIKTFLERKGIEKVEVIPHGHDPRVKKEITFGVVGRVYPSGRKGEELVAKMLEKCYNVISMGEGWPCDNYCDWSDAPKFYKKIDYLVITSRIEGGPVPLLDAMAAGVPVIAPIGVGHCDEFPCIRYVSGDWDSLDRILDKLTNPPTWKQWKKDHQSIFSSMRL
ncbi:MAG: glycosyltransferase [Candidatus Scalindua sp.]|jgi:glycosyltransferase involved in cell wall biosynthesis|nr:glycosyltransferase [Candidatus Scalindua sp.]